MGLPSHRWGWGLGLQGDALYIPPVDQPMQQWEKSCSAQHSPAWDSLSSGAAGLSAQAGKFQINVHSKVRRKHPYHLLWSPKYPGSSTSPSNSCSRLIWMFSNDVDLDTILQSVNDKQKHSSVFVRAYPAVSINLFFTSTFTLHSHIPQVLINSNQRFHLKYKKHPALHIYN